MRFIKVLRYYKLKDQQQFTLLFCGILFLATLIIYIPATFGDFIWDDDMLIVTNPLLRSLEGLKSIWLEPGAMFQYYPITHTSLWLEFQLFGSDPLPYHLTNILIHAMNSLLIWRIFAFLKIRGAFIIAFFFAVHPIHVESVAWISERKNVLSGLFYLLSLFYATKFWSLDDKKGKNQSRKFYFLTLLNFVLALHCKTVTFSLPFIIILLHWWSNRLIHWRRLALQLSPFVLLGLTMGFLTSYLERVQVGAVGDQWHYSLLERSIIAGRAFWFYLLKLIAPFQLTFIYPKWSVNCAQPLQFIWPLSIIFILIFLILWCKRIGKNIVCALTFFLITIFPALGFFNVFPMKFSFVADHFQYLASIGPLALIGSFLMHLADKIKRVKFLVHGLIILWVSALGMITWHQGHIYRNSIVLWEDTLSKNPRCPMAMMNYAANLQQFGYEKEALYYYLERTKLAPLDAISFLNIGNYYLRRRDYKKSIEEYLKSAQIDPDDKRMSFLYNNLGFSFKETGKYWEALQCYYKSMKIDKGNPMPYYNLRVLENENYTGLRMHKFPEILRFEDQSILGVV